MSQTENRRRSKADRQVEPDQEEARSGPADTQAQTEDQDQRIPAPKGENAVAETPDEQTKDLTTANGQLPSEHVNPAIVLLNELRLRMGTIDSALLALETEKRGQENDFGKAVIAEDERHALIIKELGDRHNDSLDSLNRRIDHWSYTKQMVQAALDNYAALQRLMAETEKPEDQDETDRAQS